MINHLHLAFALTASLHLWQDPNPDLDAFSLQKVCPPLPGRRIETKLMVRNFTSDTAVLFSPEETVWHLHESCSLNVLDLGLHMPLCPSLSSFLTMSYFSLEYCSMWH